MRTNAGDELARMIAMGGLVVYVDDNHINQTAMQLSFHEYGLKDKLIMQSSRLGLISLFQEVIETLIKSLDQQAFPVG